MDERYLVATSSTLSFESCSLPCMLETQYPMIMRSQCRAKSSLPILPSDYLPSYIALMFLPSSTLSLVVKDINADADA